MTARASESVDSAAAAELREAHGRVREVESRIDDRGEERIVAAADAYRSALRLLDQYEEDATGTGDFGSYVEFRGSFGELVEGLDDDALARDAFEAADDAVDKRRLKESDFDRAREALSPAERYVDLLDEREAVRETHRARTHDAKRSLRELREELDRLEYAVELGDADLDAPVERLREPTAAYHDAVEEAFDRFLSTASAREAFDFLAATEAYPLVPVRQPPRELRAYAEEHAAGEEPIPTLLEYADYSPSKLDHYVEDPGALRTTVAVHRTALERLGPEPLRLDWPPAPALELRFRLRELVSVVSRLGVPRADDAVVRLRELRDRTYDDDYARLRTAAVAEAELDAEERERLANGTLEAERDRVADAVEALRSALDEHEA